MPRPKKIKAPKPPQINKKNLLEKLVEKPTQNIKEWSIREFTLMKRLEDAYSLEFLNVIDFGKKLPSLAVLSSEWGKTELARRFHAFNYQPPKTEKIILSPEKFGEDKEVKKKQTLRDLL
jgi:hypothetical protein